MPRFSVPYGIIEAEAVVNGVLINPVLPDDFAYTPNGDRDPFEIMVWWRRPYIQTKEVTGEDGHDIWCLDGGASSRPTYYGRSDDLEEATELAWARMRHMGGSPTFSIEEAKALFSVSRVGADPEP